MVNDWKYKPRLAIFINVFIFYFLKQGMAMGKIFVYAWVFLHHMLQQEQMRYSTLTFLDPTLHYYIIDPYHFSFLINQIMISLYVCLINFESLCMNYWIKQWPKSSWRNLAHTVCQQFPPFCWFLLTFPILCQCDVTQKMSWLVWGLAW